MFSLHIAKLKLQAATEGNTLSWGEITVSVTNKAVVRFINTHLWRAILDHGKRAGAAVRRSRVLELRPARSAAE